MFYQSPVSCLLGLIELCAPRLRPVWEQISCDLWVVAAWGKSKQNWNSQCMAWRSVAWYGAVLYGMMPVRYGMAQSCVVQRSQVWKGMVLRDTVGS